MTEILVGVTKHAHENYTSAEISKTITVLFSYLNDKKVPYLFNCETNLMIPVGLTKKGKFFYANGKKVCNYMSSMLLTYGMAKW